MKAFVLELEGDPATGKTFAMDTVIAPALKAAGYGVEDVGTEPGEHKFRILPRSREAMNEQKFGLDAVISEIKRERQRQVVVEGFSRRHDDAHSSGELACAGACYAMIAGAAAEVMARHGQQEELAAYAHMTPPIGVWPWARAWWKPKNRRRDLVRAAALIVAEIERLDRAEAQSASAVSPAS